VLNIQYTTTSFVSASTARAHVLRGGGFISCFVTPDDQTAAHDHRNRRFQGDPFEPYLRTSRADPTARTARSRRVWSPANPDRPPEPPRPLASWWGPAHCFVAVLTPARHRRFHPRRGAAVAPGTQPGGMAPTISRSTRTAAAGLDSAPADTGHSTWRFSLHCAASCHCCGPGGPRWDARSTPPTLADRLVEGWSTTETWIGVTARYLADLAGRPDPAQSHGVFGNGLAPSTSRLQAIRGQSLIPCSPSLQRVRPSPPTHGLSRALIVPALPGSNTKWVLSIEIRAIVEFSPLDYPVQPPLNGSNPLTSGHLAPRFALNPDLGLVMVHPPRWLNRDGVGGISILVWFLARGHWPRAGPVSALALGDRSLTTATLPRIL